MNKFRHKAVLIIALLLSAFSVSAVDLPASLSGSYAGLGALTGWSCELRAFQFTNDGGIGFNRALTAECQTPTGLYGGGVSTSDACPYPGCDAPAVTAPLRVKGLR